jgi:hypothetical protein
LTQTGDIAIGGNLTIAGGPFTGITTNQWILSGSLICTSGLMTHYVSNFKLLGANQTFAQFDTSHCPRRVWLTSNASYLLASACYFYQLKIDAGSVLNTSSLLQVEISTGSCVGQSYNNGIITGNGSLGLFVSTASYLTIGLGTCYIANLQLELLSGGGATRTVTLTAPLYGTSNLTVNSADSTNQMWLATNGYPVSFGSITIGTRGVISWGSSLITCAGSYNDSAGAGDSQSGGQLVMTQSGSTLTLTSGTLYDLVLRDGTYTLGANLTVTNMFAHAGVLNKNGHSLTLSNPTLEYTGRRRPLKKALKRKQIQSMACRALLEDLERTQ